MIELTNTTATLLAEIGNREATEEGVAVTYRLAISSTVETNWREVNEAICRRWGFFAIERIKKMAWGVR
jgi:hypothetical protein